MQSNFSFSKDQVENAKANYGEGVYIAKRGKFEAIRVGMFSSYKDAQAHIKNNKKLFSSSIIIDDCVNDSNMPIVGTVEKITQIDDNENRIITSKTVATKATHEEIILDKLFKQKPEEEEIYDHYSYTNYFKRLLKEDEDVENSYYTNEIARIDQLIREDRYNSNVFISASSSITSEYAAAQKTKSHDTNVDLNWQYRLYDGQRTYIFDQIKKIRGQGAQIRYEDDKNNLAILGSDLYGNLLFSQTILNVYKSLYSSQESLYDIIYQNRKNGLATIVDELDAKYDLIELEKQVLANEVLHSRNTYILKQSINSKSSKPIFITPLNVSESNHSLEEEKMLIMHNNPTIALAQNTFKNDKVLILNEASRRNPTVDLSASTGYSWSKDLITKETNSGAGWDATISVNIPIYERNDIYLNEQRAKVVALQSKNDLKIATKAALNAWDNHKKTYQQLNKINSMLKEQLKGQKEKLVIIREQYLQGKADYPEYAEALNRVSIVSVDLVNNIIATQKEKLLGNYLLGKKIYNVKN